jgi:hypothetical protein
MPKADTEHTTARDAGHTRPDTIAAPRRRGLLTGTLAALLTGTAAVAAARAAPVPAAGDDAELIRLCAEFHHLTAAMAAWSVEDDDGFDAKMSERWAVSDRIMLLSATTDTGRRQKAAVALVGLEENYQPTEGQTIRTTLAALRDIAGTAIAATTAVPANARSRQRRRGAAAALHRDGAPAGSG